MAHPLLARHLLTEKQLQDKLKRGFITTHIQELNALVEGFPRGAITELTGPDSSGRTTVIEALLASATSQGEFCALIDAADTFDPHSTTAGGADLSRLLWVRCGRNAEHAIKCADMLIHGGGWGVIIVDLADVAPQTVRRIPISWWYRFRRAVENTPTALVIVEREPFVKTCASVAVDLAGLRPVWSGRHRDFRVLKSARIEVAARKPMRSETAMFEARALA